MRGHHHALTLHGSRAAAGVRENVRRRGNGGWVCDGRGLAGVGSPALALAAYRRSAIDRRAIDSNEAIVPSGLVPRTCNRLWVSFCEDPETNRAAALAIIYVRTALSILIEIYSTTALERRCL
jgi:hypothetical protein